jgi:phosphoribosylanthranilate isomerase
MLTRLKICGIVTLDDAKMCVEMGVDMLGFNFFPGSPRFVTMHTARQIINELPIWMEAVAILVRPTLEQVQDVIHKSKVNAVQIYQPIDFTDLSLIGIPVFAAFSIRELEQINSYYYKESDMFLLDNSTAKISGGTGQTFNWRQIPPEIPKKKLILAGGINTQNIDQALKQVQPAIIDVASGSESLPAQKDKKKVHKLVQKVLYHNINQLKTWIQDPES